MGNWNGSSVRLLGRDKALSAAMAGMGSAGVLLVGAPGVGKTAVAQEVLGRFASKRECHVLWLRAGGAGRGIPFGAFAPALTGVEWGAGAPPGLFSKLQMFRQAVVDLAGGKDLVLGVDDAHLLDEASATLAFQLASEANARLMVAARLGEPMPLAFRSLWKDRLLERIDLGPLCEDDTLELARSQLGGPLDGELAEALWKTSAGNPLYLRELVIAGVDSGRVCLDLGVWRLQGGLTIGPRLIELLDEKLQSTAGDLLRSLEVIALADPVPLEALNSVLPAAHVEELHRRNLLTTDPPSPERYVRTSHPLFTKLLRDRIPASRSVELRLRLAEAFETAGLSRSDLLRVVTWRVEAGVMPEPARLVEASQQAAERLDWELSARLARSAFEGGGGLEASLPLARALSHLGRHAEALDTAGSFAGANDCEVALIAVTKASIAFWGLGRCDEAQQILDEAYPRLSEAPHQAWVTAVRAGMLNYLGRPKDAVDAARAVLQTPDLRPQAADLATWALVVGLAWSGHCHEALRVLDDFEACAARGETASTARVANPYGVRWPFMARMTAYRLTGRVDDVEQLAADEHLQAQELMHPVAQGFTLGCLGWVALIRGQLSLAAVRFREAIASLERTDFLATRLYFRSLLVESLALTGDTVEAAAAVARARRDVLPPPQMALPRLHICTAWVAAARGEISRAVVELEESARLARQGDNVAYEMYALAAQVRLGYSKCSKRLDELVGEAEGPLPGLLATHARALSEGLGGSSDCCPLEALDQVSEQYAALGMRLLAAEAAAHASQLHAKAGFPRRAAASAARAQALLGENAVPLPLTIALASAPGALTPREREVAMLARSGMTSQSIATQLNLSVRTVDTHLARVYVKLGISRRVELREALGPETEV